MAKQLLGKEVTAALNEKIKANVAELQGCLLYTSDPNGVNKSVDELIAVVKDVADSIDAPLVVEGCKNVENCLLYTSRWCSYSL